MDTTVVAVAAIIIVVVVLAALLLFKNVNFEAAWRSKGGVKLGASNQDAPVQRDMAVKELEARAGHLQGRPRG